MPGRKRKPTTIKLVTGNPGHRPLNKREPKPIAGVPACPAHLTARAKKIFRRLGKTLDQMAVITKADGLALELLVGAYEEYLDARALIHDAAEEKVFQGQLVEMKDGLIYKSLTQNGLILRAHPANALGANAWRRVASMMAEFGMSPASRSRVNAIGAGEDEDPLDAFLRNRGQQEA